MTVLFRPNQVMFNNVDMTNVVTNSGGKEVTIPPGFYSIGEIIAMLNTMNNTSFSFYNGHELWVYLDIIPTLHRFHQCPGYSRNPRFRRTNDCITRFILWIECD